MIKAVFREAGQLRMSRSAIGILLLLQFAGTLMELAGLAALVPVFQYIQAEGNIAGLAVEHRWWQVLIDFYGFFGLPVTLGALLIASMTALLIRQGFVYVRLRYQASVRERLGAENRARGFNAFIHADAAYQDGQGEGRIVNDLTTEMGRAVHYIFSAVALLGVGVIFAAYLVLLLLISVPLTLIALAIFALAGVAIQGPLKKTAVVSREIVEANQSMSEFLVERLKNPRLIRLAGSEAAETFQMHRLTESQRSRMVHIFNLQAKLEIIVEPIVVGAALIFLFVSVSVFRLPLEFIGLFLILIMRLLPVLKEAARTRQSKRGMEASFRAVVERFAKMDAARELRTGRRPFTTLAQSIDFDDVHFTYPTRPNAPALNGLSTSLRAGEFTAIVGPSGGGKSTLFDMLPHLRRPTSGRILLDGVDIVELDIDSLRARIAYAPQEPQLFNVSAADHIRYGKPNASLDDIKTAAALANAANFIGDLPEGYDTLIGGGGSALSGGQRQRLDLARALVRKAPILLLDEPTSNLDVESEALFRDALARVRNETDTTIIVIAHRLSTVVMADKIIVLQDGRVVAEGSHGGLVQCGGWYADGFARQSSIVGSDQVNGLSDDSESAASC
jgi:ATP-binding cassette subfamily B protein